MAKRISEARLALTRAPGLIALAIWWLFVFLAGLGICNAIVQAVADREAMASNSAEQWCEKRDDAQCHEIKIAAQNARAATQATSYSRIQTWINAMALLGAFGAVYYARAAWSASQRSAEIARHTLENSRAHIVAEIGGVTAREVGAPIQVTIAFSNVGQTPAYRVGVKMVVEFCPPGQSVLLPKWNSVEQDSLVIGQSLNRAYKMTSVAPLSQEQLDAIVSTSGHIIVGGTILYDDIFGKTWWTEFCHMFTGGDFAGTYHPEMNGVGGPI